MWHEFRLRPPDPGAMPFRSGEDFRQWAARTLPDGASPTLFWRQTGGTPIPGAPAICFLRGRHHVALRVYTPGPQSGLTYGTAMAAAGEGAIALLPHLDQYCGGPTHVESIGGTYALSTERPTAYLVRRMILPRNRSGRSATQWQRWMSAAHEKTPESIGVPVEPQDQGRIEQAIRAGLADVLQHENPELFRYLSRHIRLTGSPRWGSPVKVGKEFCFKIHEVAFELPARLEGRWQIGSLRARGFGDVALQWAGGAHAS